jgi:hypothetical protein
MYERQLTRRTDESGSKERQHSLSISVPSELETVDVGSAFKKPQFTWLARGCEQDVSITVGRVAIGGTADNQHWTTELGDVVDRFQIGRPDP